MHSSVQKVTFSYSGRYYLEGDTAGEDIWFIFHGQGQLPQYFKDKFRSLHKHGRLLVFPEGLNRYYLAGFYGRVGAGWMTKEDRLTDIENYLIYLNQIHNQVLKGNTSRKITILGFSQGAATASRWIANGLVNCKHLILWAGILPPDMDLDTSSDIFSKLRITTVYGTEDPYVTDERISEQMRLLTALRGGTNVITFNGGHDIDPDTLARLS